MGGLLDSQLCPYQTLTENLRIIVWIHVFWSYVKTYYSETIDLECIVFLVHQYSGICKAEEKILSIAAKCIYDSLPKRIIDQKTICYCNVFTYNMQTKLLFITPGMRDEIYLGGQSDEIVWKGPVLQIVYHLYHYAPNRACICASQNDMQWDPRDVMVEEEYISTKGYFTKRDLIWIASTYYRRSLSDAKKEYMKVHKYCLNGNTKSKGMKGPTLNLIACRLYSNTTFNNNDNFYQTKNSSTYKIGIYWGVDLEYTSKSIRLEGMHSQGKYWASHNSHLERIKYP